MKLIVDDPIAQILRNANVLLKCLYRILRNIKKYANENWFYSTARVVTKKKIDHETIFFGSIIHRITIRYFLKKIQISNNQQAFKNIASIDGSKFKKTS